MIDVHDFMYTESEYLIYPRGEPAHHYSFITYPNLIIIIYTMFHQIHLGPQIDR